MDNECYICLSQDRILKNKDDLIPLLQYLTPELNNLVSTLNICWECEALLKRCKKLRSQILKAHAVHISRNVKHEIDAEPVANLENKPLSTLNTKLNTGYNYVFIHKNIHANDASQKTITIDLIPYRSNVQPKQKVDFKVFAGCSSDLSDNRTKNPLEAVDERENEKDSIEPQMIECDVIIKTEESDSELNPDNPASCDFNPDNANSDPDSDYNPDDSDENFDKSDDEIQKRGVKRTLPTKKVANKKFKVANNVNGLKQRLNNQKLGSIDYGCIKKIMTKEAPLVKIAPPEFVIPSDEDILNYLNDSMKKALIQDKDVESVNISLLSHDEAEERRKSLAANNDMYKSSKFKCSHCLLGYPSKEELDEHTSNKHVQEDHTKTALCPICSCYIYKTLFTLHYGRHRACYTCRICHTQTAEITKMRHHLKDHHKKEGKKYCNICYTEFKNSYYLRIHNNKRHNANPMLKTMESPQKWYNCPECCSRFTLDSSLKKHIQAAHKKLDCHFCSKTLPNERSFKAHIARFHKNKKKTK